MLSEAESDDYFDNRITKSAFRLELLDLYDVEQETEEFSRFLAGGPFDLAEQQPWLDVLRREEEAGIRRYRVHVVRTPLTPYLRYECEWGYVLNEPAGEEINILDLTEQPEPDGLVDHDFWLIDDQHILRVHYGDAGHYLGMELIDESELPRYRRARDAALAPAEPFGSWWARHPEEWRANRAT